MQEIEDALPYEHHKRVREDISVGVYDVIADFGQARGTNTATILPNDPLFSRRYGRTILLRRNIMREPGHVCERPPRLAAAIAEPHARTSTGDGDFQRTLWHEVGPLPRRGSRQAGPARSMRRSRITRTRSRR